MRGGADLARPRSLPSAFCAFGVARNLLKMTKAQSFNPAHFAERLGRRLVVEFDDSAMAGTPGLIGSAKEHPARKQLERLLPQSAAIGSGLIIDSFGNVSKQQDIVVYERNMCPVFTINDTPEATYYPCEGVIAVGEVKSAMGTRQLKDSIAKIISAKGLQRYGRPSEGLGGTTIPFRQYGSTVAMHGVESEQFDQETKATDQIFGFVLCARFTLVDSAIHLKIGNLLGGCSPCEAPNLFSSLANGFIAPFHDPSNKITLAIHGATGVAYCKDGHRSFPYLVQRLNWIIRNGRTVEAEAFDRYLSSAPGEMEKFTVERVNFAEVRP